MNHRKSGRKLGRSNTHRKALLRNMVTALLEHEQIQTTDAKAKELRRIAERLVTKAIRLGDDIDLADRLDRRSRFEHPLHVFAAHGGCADLGELAGLDRAGIANGLASRVALFGRDTGAAGGKG